MPSWLHEASVNKDGLVFAIEWWVIYHDLLLLIFLALFDDLSPLTFGNDVDKVFTLFVIQLDACLLRQLS